LSSHNSGIYKALWAGQASQKDNKERRTSYAEIMYVPFHHTFKFEKFRLIKSMKFTFEKYFHHQAL
jgi:hypothetical protein